MKNSYRKIGLYLLASFLSKLVSFIFLPWFTKVLTPEDIGSINVFLGIISFVAPFIAFGTIISISVEYYTAQKMNIHKNLILTSLIFPLFFTLLTFIILIGLFFSGISFVLPYKLLFLIPICAIANLFLEFLMLIYRLEDKLKSFFLFSIFKIIFEVFFTIYLLHTLGYEYENRIYGIFISYLIVILIFCYWFIKNDIFSGKFKLNLLKKEIKIGISTIFTMTNVFLIFTFDKLVISYLLGIYYTGIYSLATSFSLIIIAVSSSLNNYFQTRIYSHLSYDINSKLVFKEHKSYFLIITGFFVLIMLIIPLIFDYFIDPKFKSSLAIFYILNVSYYFWAINTILMNILWFFKKNRIIRIVSFLSIVVFIPILFFFTNKFGVFGTAFVILSLVLLQVCVSLYFVNKINCRFLGFKLKKK